MKFVIAVLSLVLSFSATSNTLSFRGGDQTILDEKFLVPGNNPLNFCQEPSEYVLNIDHVDLAPNPPKPCVLFIRLFKPVIQSNKNTEDKHSRLRPREISLRKLFRGLKFTYKSNMG